MYDNAVDNSYSATIDADLSSVSTQELLGELFNRYREAIFVGHHPQDVVNPLHMATHIPNERTGMHSVLTCALQRVLGSLQRKYPDNNGDVQGAIVIPG
jgi:hypothetical protein